MNRFGQKRLVKVCAVRPGGTIEVWPIYLGVKWSQVQILSARHRAVQRRFRSNRSRLFLFECREDVTARFVQVRIWC